MNYHSYAGEIPEGSILGINYSGMHDTSVALVSPEGETIFAISLERISRVKQDGRSPIKLLRGLPWENISKVGLSVEREYIPTDDGSSRFHPIQYKDPVVSDRAHGDAFLERLDFIPREKVFVPHHLCHAASAFWLSDFKSAICLVYDGVMANENWFGGVYTASRHEGITSIDQFCDADYANVTRLYSAITALLGFTPLKHEGKITGLAAYGKVTNSCVQILEEWLCNPEKLCALFQWKDLYSLDNRPRLESNDATMEILREALSEHSREDLAATVQYITEEHIIKILSNIVEKEGAAENLCLSGGLFANVKVNQRASEVFRSVFVSPPMSDDGTALGAALHVASESKDFNPKPIRSMSLGSSFSKNEVSEILKKNEVKFLELADPAKQVAELLSDGSIVAIFQGAMEFGPRALGNRSILASASDPSINVTLNSRLSRTEFMPFAPICLAEDAGELFKGIERVSHAAQFMTVTVDCTEKMSLACPAVVHCDGTARPQLVLRDSHSFMYELISNYKQLSGRPALANTSFNVHEEPIVCSTEDALKGFFDSGLDALFIEGYLVRLSENKGIEAKYLREKIKRLNEKNVDQSESNKKSTILMRKQATKVQLELIAENRWKKRLLEEQELRFDQVIEESKVTETQLERVLKESKVTETQLERVLKESKVTETQLERALKESKVSRMQVDRLSQELQSVYQSKSWAITQPVRVVMRYLTLSVNQLVRHTDWLIRLPKRIARRLVVVLMTFFINYSRIRTWILPWLLKYPRLLSKLHQLALSHGLVEPMSGESLCDDDEDFSARLELSLLSSSALEVYNELKGSIKKEKVGHK